MESPNQNKAICLNELPLASGRRGFLIHSFPFFSLASVDSLSTQGKIKIAFALAQRDETD